MLLEKRVLFNVSEDVTSANKVAYLQGFIHLEVPFFFLVQARKLDTSWDEHTLGNISNFF
jgi:hypothetical protein